MGVVVSMGTRNKIAARRRQACTNESYETLRRLFDRGAPRRMPTAFGAQALLESQVMESLASGSSWGAHPAGVAGVRIAPSELVVCLSGHTVLDEDDDDGTTEPMTVYAANQLLPVAEGSSGEPYGVSGLRARPLNRTDLLLGLVGTSARVVLRAQRDTDWPMLLDHWRSQLTEDETPRWLGYRPLWSEPTLTRSERGPGGESVRTVQHDRAALGSALLRRIGWFEHYSAAFSTKIWVNLREWNLELESSYDAALPHGVLLDAMADPVWGMGLAVRKQDCTCAAGRQSYPRGTSCTFDLGADAQRTSLQIRFKASEVGERSERRAVLASMGAEDGWLNRVLPDQTHTKQADRHGAAARGNR